MPFPLLLLKARVVVRDNAHSLRFRALAARQLQKVHCPRTCMTFTNVKAHYLCHACSCGSSQHSCKLTSVHHPAESIFNLM